MHKLEYKELYEPDFDLHNRMISVCCTIDRFICQNAIEEREREHARVGERMRDEMSLCVQQSTSHCPT